MSKTKTIGAQIAYWRKKKKLTQEELALQVGLKGKTIIHMYESGVRNPSFSTIEKIADALGCSFEARLLNKK